MSHGLPSTEKPFPDLHYDRVCRTLSSEAYLLSEADSALGRVDLHFGSAIVHAVLVVEHDLDEEAVHDLIQRIDEDLVWTADQPRDDFMVTVYRGNEIGVVSDHAADAEEETAPDSNG